MAIITRDGPAAPAEGMSEAITQGSPKEWGSSSAPERDIAFLSEGRGRARVGQEHCLWSRFPHRAVRGGVRLSAVAALPSASLGALPCPVLEGMTCWPAGVLKWTLPARMVLRAPITTT
jgi:hypothetical protein